MGLGVKDALGDVNSHKDGSDAQSRGGKEGRGVMDCEGLHRGTKSGHVVSAGSQQAFGGSEGRLVPVPGGHCGTKSGHGNFSGSQHALDGMGVIVAVVFLWQINCVDVQFVRAGSQQPSGG